MAPSGTSKETSSSAAMPPKRRCACSTRKHQSAACSERPPADCMPAIIPGGEAPFGKRDEHLAEQRVRLPALRRVEQLTGAPARERVHGAAPDVEHLAGDRLRLVGAERDDDGGDVRRVERVEALLRCAHLERLLGHARARVRREAVDGDAVALELLRDDDREAGDARLRGAVVRLADVAEDARRARGADDASAHLLAGLRLLAPVRGGVLRRREVPFEVDGDDGVPLRLGHVHEHPVAEDPGVVDEDVEAAEVGRSPAATIRPAPAKSATFSPFVTASPPAALISSTTCCAGVASAPSPASPPPRSLTTTFAPAAASASACERPMPRPAPVTIATFPVRSGMRESLLLCEGPRARSSARRPRRATGWSTRSRTSSRRRRSSHSRSTRPRFRPGPKLRRR